MTKTHPCKITFTTISSFLLIKKTLCKLSAVVDDVAADDVGLAGVSVPGESVLAAAVVTHVQLVEVAGRVRVAVFLDVAAGICC